MHQTLMRALLFDVAIFHHQEQIGLLDGGQSVGDDKARPALHQLVHGALDAVLGEGIDIGSGLVQEAEHALSGGGHGLHLAGHLSELRNGPRKVAHIGGEGLDIPQEIALLQDVDIHPQDAVLLTDILDCRLAQQAL